MTSNSYPAREWTPFSARPVLESSAFGLPINKPCPIPMAPGTRSDRWFMDSPERKDEFSDLRLTRPRNSSSPFPFSSPSANFHMSPTSSMWASSTDSSIIGSPIFQANDTYDMFIGKDLEALIEPEFEQDLAPEFALTSMISQIPVSNQRATILFHGEITSKEDELVLRLKLYFTVFCAKTTREAMVFLGQNSVDCIVTKIGDGESVKGIDLVRHVRKHPASARMFILFFSRTAALNPIAQTTCFRAGANVVTNEIDEIHTTCVRALKSIGRDPFSVGSDTYQCPLCQFDGLTEDELCDHVVLYHGSLPNSRDVSCPICTVLCKGSRMPFPVHMHKTHGPLGRARRHIPRKQHHTYIFALIVCQRLSDRRFLMVNEPASWGWWIPGGRVEWGESLRLAAMREAKDEAGVDINIQGILKLEYTAGPSRTRERFIFYANPVDEDNCRAKCVPDYDSRGACWVSLEEVDQLPLRGEEPRKWFHYIENGGQIYPMSLLSIEGE